MNHESAHKIAFTVCNMIKAQCDDLMICGDLRRGIKTIKEIDIVCMPKQYNGLPCADYVDAINQFTFIKGSGTGKQCTREFLGYPEQKTFQVSTDSNCDVDIDITPRNSIRKKIKINFTNATPENFGYMVALRTGSPRWFYRVCSRRWVKDGYRGRDGYIYKFDELIPLRNESDLFRLVNVPFVKPERRR